MIYHLEDEHGIVLTKMFLPVCKYSGCPDKKKEKKKIISMTNEISNPSEQHQHMDTSHDSHQTGLLS